MAAATAGAIGFAVSYLRARYGAAVIIVGALVFFFTFTQAPPWPSPPGFAPTEAPRTAVVDATVSLLLPEIIRIPAGSFLMGSPDSEPGRRPDEGPQHRVQVAGFDLGKTEVTFAQWDACVAAGGCTHRPGDSQWGRDSRPVISVSRDDAQQYVAWLSRQTGQPWRLPTEAEWEYAARAGTQTPFSTGHCISTREANYNGNIDYAGCGTKTGTFLAKTQPVGKYPANPWGLSDMHGNVSEWVQDCGHDACPAYLTSLRGGSWYHGPESLRSAARRPFYHEDRSDYVGFRVARTLTR